MSAVHPARAVTILRTVAEGAGGQTCVVCGDGTSAGYYAGLHRAPSPTLLEAVLTWMAGSYEEIVLFSGLGSHLPALRINEVSMLGSGRAAVYLRRIASERPAEPVKKALADDVLDQFFGNIKDAQKRRAARASLVSCFGAKNLVWNDRVPRMLDLFERWCGVDHLGSPLQRIDTDTAVRRLVIIDAEFLIPDTVTWRQEIAVSPAETGEIPVRLSQIPKNCANTRTDTILLTRDEPEAQSVESGQLITRRLADDAAQHGQLNMKWREVASVVLPSRDLSPAFSAHYRESRPLVYEHFLSTAPCDPKGLRVIPLEKLTIDLIFNRLREEIIGQDNAMRAIAETIVTNIKRREPTDQRPIASFLLAGPTGSGKTSTAKALARALFGDNPRHYHGVLMEQHQTKLELFGTPPGFVGFKDSWRTTGGGVLTTPLVQHPNRPMLILLDELEKGDPEAVNMLFGVIDEGEATDASAKLKVSFRNVVLVITTNEAAPALSALVSSSDNWEQTVRQAKTIITTQGRSRWPPAFLGRFRDGVLPLCYPPREELIKTIQQKTINEIRQGHRLGVVDPQFLELVCDTYDRGSGVRGIEARVKQLLESQLLAIPENRRLNVDATGDVVEAPEGTGGDL